MKRTALIVFVLFTQTVPVAATEIEEIGIIQTTFEGESFTQPTVLMTGPNETTSTAYLFRAGAGFSSLTLSSLSKGKPRVFLEVGYIAAMPSLDTAPIMTAVTYAPSGTGQHWSSEEAPVLPRVTFTALDIDGDEGRAVGTFEALLCFTKDYGEDADLGNCRSIQGRFDSRFIIQE